MIEFAKTVEMFGFTSLEARLFSYLYLEERPLTLDEMSEALGKSKTSMSTSVRSLADMNLVTRVWRKGVRKDLYKANKQLFKTFMTTYSHKWVEATNHQKDALMEIQKLITEEDSERQLDDLSTKLKDILEFHQLIEQSFRNLKST